MSAKSRKVPRSTLPLFLNVLSENGIIFILIGLFLRSKIMLISQKRVFYKRGTRINMGKYITSQVFVVWCSSFIQLYSRKIQRPLKNYTSR